MRKRMKGFTSCGDCIHYNYKKHKCNLGASIETDARNPFYDDCPIPNIPSEQEIRDKAIEEFVAKMKSRIDDISKPYNPYSGCAEPGVADYDEALDDVEVILDEIVEQMKR